MDNNNFPTFGVSNFKSYSDLQQIELAPITLIYGQNSGGKTSFLESIMAMAQSILDINNAEFNTNGRYINAGTFTTIKNKNPNSKKSPFIIYEIQSNYSKEYNYEEKNIIYIESLEPLLSPKIRVYLGENKSGESNSKFNIEKIELKYGKYLKGLSLVFSAEREKANYVYFSDPRSITSNNYRLRLRPDSDKEIVPFYLEENSINNLTQISNSVISEISSELSYKYKLINFEELYSDNYLYADKKSKAVEIKLPQVENKFRNFWFSKENPIYNNALLKIAVIKSGGWIDNSKRGKLFFIKFNGLISENINIKKLNKIKDLIENQIIRISEDYKFLIKQNHIKPSLYINTVSSLKKLNEVNRVDIKFIQDLSNLSFRSIKDRNKEIYNQFIDEIEEVIYENGKASTNIINLIAEEIEIKKDILLKSISRIIQINEEIIENYKFVETKKNRFFKITELQKEVLKNFSILEEKFSDYISGFNKLQKNFITDNNNDLVYREALTTDLSSLESSFGRISNYFSELKGLDINKKDSNDYSEFLITIKVINDHLKFCKDETDYIYYSILADIRILKINKIIFDKESEELFNNLSKSSTVDLLNWLCNNSQIRNRSFYWGNSTIESPLLKKSVYPDALSINPFFNINFLPFQISSKIVHLKEARPGGERLYTNKMVNETKEGDVGYILKINDKKDKILKQISSQLKESNIAEKIEITSSSDREVDIRRILITPKDSKYPINIVDTGYGLSQILPIIFNAFSPESQTIIVQQPETHLHPRLQAEIGSILVNSFIKVKTKNKLLDEETQKNWILETHSETILLRLLKEIRRGKLNHKSLRVYYIDKNEEGSSIIKKMKISEDGNLISKWPDGFFSTDLDEMFD